MSAFVLLAMAPAALASAADKAAAAPLSDIAFDLRLVAGPPPPPTGDIVVTARRSPWRLRDDLAPLALDPPPRIGLRLGNAIVQPEVVTGRLGEGQVHMVLRLPF
ncbi:hypothetical protein IP88_05540 [alpha proteobacterium AAP81b]|nr:hypothetical protein IP88_05540 [alpha proteobacterium AAP81b]